jgi:hypothetical protein
MFLAEISPPPINLKEIINLIITATVIIKTAAIIRMMFIIKGNKLPQQIIIITTAHMREDTVADIQATITPE